MTTYVRRSTANKTQQATLRNTAHTTRVFGYCRVSAGTLCRKRYGWTEPCYLPKVCKGV